MQALLGPVFGSTSHCAVLCPSHAYMLLTAGVTAQDSRGEVQRLIDTFKIAAEEATRLYGEAC